VLIKIFSIYIFIRYDIFIGMKKKKDVKYKIEIGRYYFRNLFEAIIGRGILWVPKSKKIKTGHGEKTQSASSNQQMQTTLENYTISEGGWVSVNTGSSANRAALDISRGSTDGWLKK
jgi:hypothetical protein